MARIVLVPGIIGAEGLWSRVVGQLARDHEVRAICLPQQGASLHELASKIERDISWAEFHLVGFSLGGLVARALAESNPQRVQGLVMLGSLPERASLPLGIRLSSQFIRWLPQGSFGGVYRSKLGWSLKKEGLGKNDIQQLCALLPSKELYLQRLDMIAAWGLQSRIMVPALLLKGEGKGSASWSIQQARDILPNVEVRGIPGGHYSLWTHAEATAQCIGEFVQRNTRQSMVRES